MANMDGKVCPNHPDTAATTRCVKCFKPLCSSCVAKQGGQDFCSAACAQEHTRSNALFGDVQAADRRRKRKKMIRNAVLFVLLAIGAAYGWQWYQKQDQDALAKKVKGAGNSLIDAASDAQKNYENAIEERKAKSADLGGADYSQ